MCFVSVLKKYITPVLFGVLLLIASCNQEPTTSVQTDNNNVQGVIADEQGNGVPNALVQITSPQMIKSANKILEAKVLLSAKTDEDGKFTIDQLPHDLTNLQLRIVHGDFRVFNQDIQSVLAGKDKKHLSLMMEHDSNCRSRLEITVLRKKDSTPVQSVEVRFRRGADLVRKAYTDANGKLIFEHVCQGTYNLRLYNANYSVKEIDSLNFGINDTLKETIYLLQDSCCEGIVNLTVKGKDGGALKDVLGRLYKNGTLVGDFRTDANGYYQLTGMCQGGYKLTINLDGYQEQAWEFNIDCNATLNFEKTMLVYSDSCCKGMVTFFVKDSSNNPLNGVTVNLWKGSTKLTSVKTNDQGKYIFTKMCEGTYQISFQFEGYKAQEFNFTLTCDDTIEIDKTMLQVPRDSCCNGTIKFIVRDDSTRALIQNATVKIWKAGTLLGSYTTDANGVVTFTKLCKGEYGFDILREHYKHIEFAVTIDCDQTLEVEKTLKAEIADSCCNGVIKFTVIDDATRNALLNATVKIWKNGTLLGTYTTNAEGVVTLTKLCKGTYGFNILREHYKAIEFSVTIDCNQTLELTKPLVAELPVDTCCHGQLKFIVLDSATGARLTNATVNLWKGSTKIASKLTNGDGAVGFDGLCKGDYSISISMELYKGVELSFSMDCNELKTMDRRIAKKAVDTCRTAILKIRALENDSTETPIIDAGVTLMKDGQTIATLSTNAEGWVTFTGLDAPATYKVIIGKQGYNSQDYEFRFNECNTQSRSFRLTR